MCRSIPAFVHSSGSLFRRNITFDWPARVLKMLAGKSRYFLNSCALQGQGVIIASKKGLLVDDMACLCVTGVHALRVLIGYAFLAASSLLAIHCR